MASQTLAALMDNIYKAFEKSGGSKQIISQDDVLKKGIIPDDNLVTLVQIAQGLCNDKRWKIVTDSSGGTAWRVRSLEEAKKYRALKPEDEIVYALIDESGPDGIWLKTIRSRSQLHDALVNAAIKHLTSKAYITEMKSVEANSRKMYIKIGIVQSERTKGGAWFTDGELDEFFIETVRAVLYQHILGTSLYLPAKAQAALRQKEPKRSKKISPEQAQALRDKVLGERGGAPARIDTIEEERLNQERQKAYVLERQEIIYDGYIPMPAGYMGYKTLDELTEYILAQKVAMGVVLTSKDLKQLLDVMCFDGMIETVHMGRLDGYKATRQSVRPDTRGPYNRLTEAPCGRCPVFDLCEEGGPVGPSNCKYFEEWLNL